MSIRVTTEGKKWNGSSWAENTEGVMIGLRGQSGQGTYLQCMTIFSIVPDKLYSSITLSITMSRSGPKARYSTNSPGSPGGSSGTDKQFSVGSNTITLTGTFNSGTTYRLYVWGINYSSYDYGTVTSASATGVEPPPVVTHGTVRIYVGSGFVKYRPKIYSGSGWSGYTPYVYDNGQWRKMV